MDDDVETRLRAALREALKTRDVVAAFALRSALGAIGNAEAVPVDAAAGPSEVSRRELSAGEVCGIVQAEIGERETTAGQYEQAGHPDRAGRLRREAQILRAMLEG